MNDTKEVRKLAELEWECPKCGFAFNKVHYEENRPDPCPACHEIELADKLASAADRERELRHLLEDCLDVAELGPRLEARIEAALRGEKKL